MNTATFYAHGKLLLSGEYFVLDGAITLAIPTKLGQVLEVKKDSGIPDDRLTWHSLDVNNNKWLALDINIISFKPINSSGQSDILISLLKKAVELNPDFRSELSGTLVETKLEFPNNWGLGSSSTVISLIAQWANVNPFDLQQTCLPGSGYDIACATAKSAVLYQIINGKPDTKSCSFNPPFIEQLYFVHLGKKQNSREGIEHYRDYTGEKEKYIKWFSSISEEFLHTDNLEVFEDLIVEHEELISGLLNLEMVKAKYFGDYWGAVKSLGAWGGDFVMATSNKSRVETIDYFKQKGFTTVIPYADMIYKD